MGFKMPPVARFEARILRKQPDLPRYVVIRPEYLPGRTRSFQAVIFLDETGPFLRNIRPWGKGSDAFFFNLTQPQCRKAGLDTNDRCVVTIVAPGLDGDVTPAA